jgi:hypothetical protein
MSDKTGGPAFPSKYDSGMTLRDYFAVHASEEDIRQCIVRGGSVTCIADRTAARYRHADCMLKERNKT